MQPYNRLVEDNKIQSYATWFHSPIKDIIGDEGNMTHGQYIMNFYKTIKAIMQTHHYKIKDDKQFKKEIATFIYQLSSENTNERFK